MTQLVWIFIHSSKFVQNFYRGGAPGFRILCDRKSWVSKDQVTTSISATVHSEFTLSEFETHH